MELSLLFWWRIGRERSKLSKTWKRISV